MAKAKKRDNKLRYPIFIALGLYTGDLFINNVSNYGIYNLESIIGAFFIISITILLLSYGFSFIPQVEKNYSKLFRFPLIGLFFIVMYKFQLSIGWLAIFLISLFALFQGIGFIYPPFQRTFIKMLKTIYDDGSFGK